MDAVDLVILDRMTSPDAILFGGLDPRHAPEAMAAKVGLTANVIRKRMAGWRASGFLVRWHALPHPAHFGQGHFVGYYAAKRPADRERLLETWGEAEGAVACFEQVGGLVGCGVYAANEEAAIALLGPIGKLEGVRTLTAGHRVQLAPLQRPWTADEVAVFKRLRLEPEAAPSTIATAVGKDANAITATLASIAETGGLFTTPELDFSRFQGVLVRVMFDVDAPDPRAAYEALAAKHDASFYRDVGTPGEACGHAMVCLRSISLMDDLEGDVLSIPGVTDVEVQIPRRFRLATRWLDEQCNAM